MKRTNILNDNFSTTKLCYKILDYKYLDKNGKVKDEYKFKLNFPEFGIVNSKIPVKDGEKFDTYLFLPKGEDRKKECGLRTKGYFKFSYEKKDRKWWIVEDKKFIKKVKLDEEVVKNYEKLPLITIITVVFNGEKYLEETIQSIINQTYSNVEYIIIDGGSTDGTLDIIRKYEDKIDYWVSEEDDGIYDAMNKGVKVSNGIFINFLNAGDKFVSDGVIKSIANVAQNNIKLIYGNTLFYNEIKNTIKKQISMEFTFKYITKYTTRVVCHQSMFININNFVPYNLQYKLKGELQLYFELALQRESYIKMDKEIAIFLENGIGTQRFLENTIERVSVIYRYSGIIGLLYAFPYLCIGILSNIKRGIK